MTKTHLTNQEKTIKTNMKRLSLTLIALAIALSMLLAARSETTPAPHPPGSMTHQSRPNQSRIWLRRRIQSKSRRPWPLKRIPSSKKKPQRSSNKKMLRP